MTNKSKRKVKELKHHPENSNMYILSDLDSLQENIEDNGLLVPLVVDQFNQVISGNRRLECIIRLGWETVDVHEIEVKEEDDIKFLIYSFNKQRKKTIGEIIQEILMLKEYFSVGSGYRKHVNKDGTYKRKDWTKSVIS